MSRSLLKTPFTLALVAALSLPGAALAAEQSWQLDTAHTDVGFRVRHMMVSDVKGRFNEFKGTIKLDEKDLAKSLAVDVVIQTKSIDTNEEKRDGHLRSPDFFDSDKHPTLTFVSKQGATKKVGKGKYKVKGDLTIRGVTKPVTLDVEGFEQSYTDPWGNAHRGGTATTTISRKDFGLTWNKALEKGGVLVGDEVKIVLDIELVPAAAPTKS